MKIVGLLLGCLTILGNIPGLIPDGMCQHLMSVLDLRDVVATVLGLCFARARIGLGV